MVYLDTSIVAPLLLPEATSDEVEVYLQNFPAGELSTSAWTKVEFSSLVSRKLRMGELNELQAEEVRAELDRMLADSYQVLLPSAADYELAAELLKNYKTGLRAGDGLHLAVAHNQGAEKVLSLDAGLIKAAKQLGIPAETGIKELRHL
jgi:predicted nucleic acid-binding protein